MMKKIVLAIILIVVLSLCVSALFACASKSEGDTPNNYIISFNTNGGSQIKSITLKAGSSLTLPEPPTKEGYVFLGWFFDNKLEREVNVAMFRAVSNITIFAGWESVDTYRHHIKVGELENGEISILNPSDARASKGTEVVVSVSADDGYELVYNTLKANNILLQYESGQRYKFIMPPEEVTITCEFDLKPMSVSVMSTIKNGEVVLSTDYAKRGELVSVQVIPDYGYRLTELYLFDGNFENTNGKTSIINTQSFFMGGNATFVGATFEEIDYSQKYKINAAITGQGSVILENAESPAGLFVNLSFEAQEGYLLDRFVIQGGGLFITSMQQEGFIMPDSDVSITAYFIPESIQTVKNTLTITPSENGSIVLNYPKNHYIKGEMVHFTIAPALGYTLDKVYLNGIPLLSNYFRMPNESATLTADFIKMGYKIGVVANNCEVFLSQNTAYPGEIIYFDIVEFEGYNVNPAKILLNGKIISGNSFVMPESDVNLNVVAYAAGSTHLITAQSVAGGSFVASHMEAPIYSKVAITPTPNEGYRFKEGSLFISYLSQGETITKSVSGNTFVMPDSDVTINGQFERVYSVISTDDGTVGLYPSANEIAVGESIYVDFVGHGNVIADSIKVTIEFGAYTEALNASRVFELNQIKVLEAGDLPVLRFKYSTYSEVDANRLYTITVLSSEGGIVKASSSACYGERVLLDVIPDSGYKLSSLTASTNKGDMFNVGDSFIMPDGAITISATFVEADEVSFGLRAQYEKNLKGFNDALMKVVYYSERYQLIDAYPELANNSFVNYVVGAVKVNSMYGHDFYIIEVDDVSKVNPIAYSAHHLIADRLKVDLKEINVKINYNYIILSVGGSAEEDFYLYKNGVKVLSDYVIYERENGTYGIYAYMGKGGYISLIDRTNGRNVTYLSSKAFLHPENIMGVSIQNVTEIGDFAFENTNISYIDLAGVEKLGKGVFKNTLNLKAITVSSRNKYYYSLSGVLYQRGSQATHTLYAYPQGKNSQNGSFEIPTQTQRIASYAFYGANLKVISYGGALAEIGDYAFASSALTSLKYHSSSAVEGVVDFSNSNTNRSNVSVLGDGVFSGVYTLNSFYLESVISIGSGAITWDGTSNVVVNLSNGALGVVKAKESPIVIPNGHVGTLSIYLPSELKNLYEASANWMYYRNFVTFI